MHRPVPQSIFPLEGQTSAFPLLLLSHGLHSRHNQHAFPSQGWRKGRWRWRFRRFRRRLLRDKDSKEFQWSPNGKDHGHSVREWWRPGHDHPVRFLRGKDRRRWNQRWCLWKQVRLEISFYHPISIFTSVMGCFYSKTVNMEVDIPGFPSA